MTIEGPMPFMVSIWISPHSRRSNVTVEGVPNFTTSVESAPTDSWGEAMLRSSESSSGWNTPMRYLPGGTESIRKRPSESVSASDGSPSTETWAPDSARPCRLSITTPAMVPKGLCGAPVCAGAGAAGAAVVCADATLVTVEATATSRANRATGPASRVINPHRGGRHGWDHKIRVPQCDARLSIRGRGGSSSRRRSSRSSNRRLSPCCRWNRRRGHPGAGGSAGWE